MVIYSTKKSLFIFTLLLVSVTIFAQTRRDIKERRPQISRIIEDEIRPFIEDKSSVIPQVPPEGVADENLQYFLRERKGITHFRVCDKQGVEHSVRLDSLIFYHRIDIDDFISKFNQPKSPIRTDLEKGIYKTIRFKIDSLKTIKLNKRNTPYFDGVFELIRNLPPSREKILLLFDYARLEIRNETYYDDVFFFCNEASKVAKELVDLTDKGLAYFDIGDFAYWFMLYDFSIKMYYLAREFIGEANITSQKNFYQQGEICTAIANLFYSLQLTHGFEEEHNYLFNAIQYYIKAEDYNNANSNALWDVSDRTFLWFKNFQDHKGDLWAKNNNEENIKTLHNWYDRYKMGYTDSIANYYGLFSMAEYMTKYDNEVALSYFLQAFQYAIRSASPNYVISAIENIEYICVLLKKENLALAYSDLELYLTSHLKGDQFSYYDALLNKAFLFYDIKKYDSSLNYVNGILSDTSLGNEYYPPSYDYLIEKASRIKYQSLDALGIDMDEARYCEVYSLTYKLNRQEDFSYLLSAEATSIQGWLDRSKNKVNEFEVELRKSAEFNAKAQEMLRVQSDSLREQAIIRENDALSKKRISDSLNQLNKSLLTLKDAIRTKDSINAASELSIANKEIVRARNEKYYFIIGALLGIGLLTYFFNLRNRNRKIKLLAEKNYVSSLAMNKFHNFKNDFHVLPNMLHQGDIEKAKKYTDEYGTYQGKVFENWKKGDDIVLEDEIALFEQYVKAKVASGQPIYFEIEYLNKCIDAKKTRFIQSVFDTLLDNSVRSGFKKRKGVCNFFIKIDASDIHLTCEISDNGIPPLDASSYLRRQKSGLNILKSRIELEFKIKNKRVPKDFFSIEKLSENEGTIVKMKIPYEQIAYHTRS